MGTKKLSVSNTAIKERFIHCSIKSYHTKIVSGNIEPVVEARVDNNLDAVHQIVGGWFKWKTGLRGIITRPHIPIGLKGKIYQPIVILATLYE